MAPLDFTEYDRLVNLYRAGSPNIAASMDENKRLLIQLEGGPTPPPPGTLRYKPPGYPTYTGYTTVVANNGAERMDLDNSKDYIIDMSTKTWSSGSGRTIGLHINGGRNVVVIGGRFTFNRTNAGDDSTAILVDVGATGGVVHLEGLDIDCANGITIRTKRAVQIENTRIKVWTYQDNYGSVHPDVVQVWGTDANNTPCAAIRMHKVTCHTRYTGLVCLVERSPAGGVNVDPLTWERYEVDIHPDTNLNGSKDAGNYAYHCSGPVGATGTNGGPFCVYKGDVYAELPTFGAGAGTRGIDDIAILKSLDANPDRYFPYEIHSPSGATLFTSALAPSGGSGRSEARQTGNYMTFAREPALAQQRWFIGKPSGGDFCPAGVPGPSYVSPGYL